MSAQEHLDFHHEWATIIIQIRIQAKTVHDSLIYASSVYA